MTRCFVTCIAVAAITASLLAQGTPDGFNVSAAPR